MINHSPWLWLTWFHFFYFFVEWVDPIHILLSVIYIINKCIDLYTNFFLNNAILAQCDMYSSFLENTVYLDNGKSVCKHTQCENPVTYLFGPEHHWHHALGLRGLCALIDEDGAKLHLSQARVTRTHTCAADHICILRNRERTRCVQTSVTGGLMHHSYKETNSAFFNKTLCAC